MSKVRDLPEITSLEDNDLVYAVDSSAGTNGGRKITKANLKESVKQDAADIKTDYESNADTNAFTDDEKTKLAGIETGATQDQTAAEVPYDNNGSSLSALNVKDGLDELDAEKEPVFVKNSAFNKEFGSSAGTVVEGNDNRLSTVQKLTVKKNPGSGQFSNIKDAIDSIADASASKPYQVNIGPGIYEEDTITVPSYVHVRGERGATIVEASNPNDDIFLLNSNSSVAQLAVQGATGPGASAFKRIGGSTEASIDLIEFGDNTNLVFVDSTAGAPTVIVNTCRIKTGVEFVDGFKISGSGNGTLIVNNLTGFIFGTGINPTSLFDASGSTNKLIILASNTRIEAPGTLQNGILAKDGVQIFISAMNLIGPTKGLSVPNTGDGPILDISGLSIADPITYSVEILNPNTTGFLNGAWSLDKVRSTLNYISISYKTYI